MPKRIESRVLSRASSESSCYIWAYYIMIRSKRANQVYKEATYFHTGQSVLEYHNTGILEISTLAMCTILHWTPRIWFISRSPLHYYDISSRRLSTKINIAWFNFVFLISLSLVDDKNPTDGNFTRYSISRQHFLGIFSTSFQTKTKNWYWIFTQASHYLDTCSKEHLIQTLCWVTAIRHKE